MALSIILIVFCMVTAGVFLTVRIKKGGVWGVITKILASLTFVICGVVALSRFGKNLSPTFSLMTIGLIFGMVGDILLDLKVVYPKDKNIYLNFGMLSFGLGHICYFSSITLLLNYVNKLTIAPYLWSLLAASLATTIIMLMSKKMKLEFGKFLIQSISYCFLLTFMVTLSIFLASVSKVGFIFMIGMILFLISDLVLSIMYFTKAPIEENVSTEKQPILIFTNHALYYCAQIMIVIFMLFF